MPNNSYTDKQIEAMNMLRSVSDGGVPQDVMEQIVAMVAEQDTTAEKPVDETEDIIKMKMMEEPSWRKRAALAAMIISKKLN